MQDEVFAAILAETVEVLGAEERAWSWLHSAVPALRYRRPVDLIETPEGVDLVRQELDAIRYGMWS